MLLNDIKLMDHGCSTNSRYFRARFTNVRKIIMDQNERPNVKDCVLFTFVNYKKNRKCKQA